MIQHVMLLGGPGDGRVIEFDTTMDVFVYPVERDVFEKDPSPSAPLDYTTYQHGKLATPDHWVQVVYVHIDVDLDSMPESEMIRAIMEPWRAKMRAKAHLPSGFSVTRESTDPRSW